MPFSAFRPPIPLANCWSHYSRTVRIGVASFGVLSELKETARRYPSRVGICKARRRADRSKDRTSVASQKLTARFTNREFRSVFRMSRFDFYELLELIRPQVTKDIEMGKRGGNETVSPDCRLAITLRMLAGTRYGDLMLSYCIKQSTVYNVFHDTGDALKDVLKFPLLPKTDEGLRRLANGMKLSRGRGNPLTGCIGALDGICIKIEKPRSDLNPALFYCRKGYYAIHVQALVDHSYRFLCASANCVGSTHDLLAHSSSKLGLYLMRGLLGRAYWIAGDEAYIFRGFFPTPYPASQLLGFIFRQSFNFFLSSMRMHVEQAFSMLKEKWLILDHLKFSTQKCSSLILLTMKLHNYCLDASQGRSNKHSQGEINRMREESEEWYRLAKRDDFDRVDSLGRCSTFGDSEEANFGDAAFIRREHFIAHLEVLGIPRPDRILLCPSQRTFSDCVRGLRSPTGMNIHDCTWKELASRMLLLWKMPSL